MRTLTALLALVTLTACGPGEDVEQRDPRCDYSDDREWQILRAYQTDTACSTWSPYDPYTCQGQGCLTKCGGASADERQGDYDVAVIDMISDPFVDILVECAQADGSIEIFTCSETARVLLTANDCTEATRLVPTIMFDPTGQTPPASYSVVWQIPAQ